MRTSDSCPSAPAELAEIAGSNFRELVASNCSAMFRYLDSLCHSRPLQGRIHQCLLRKVLRRSCGRLRRGDGVRDASEEQLHERSSRNTSAGVSAIWRGPARVCGPEPPPGEFRDTCSAGWPLKGRLRHASKPQTLRIPKRDLNRAPPLLI